MTQTIHKFKAQPALDKSSFVNLTLENQRRVWMSAKTMLLITQAIGAVRPPKIATFEITRPKGAALDAAGLRVWKPVWNLPSSFTVNVGLRFFARHVTNPKLNHADG